MKKKEKNKRLFNYIFYIVLIGVIIIFLIFVNGFISAASTSSNAFMYYEEFEDNIKMYEKLDYSKQLLVPKSSRYSYVKKNLLKRINETKKDNEERYFDELYDKYGETAIKAYYYSFIEPNFQTFYFSIKYLLFSIIVIVLINLVYKKFSFNGAMLSSALLIFGLLSSLLLPNLDLDLLIPIVLVVFVNISINYFLFDRSKRKKS